MSKPAQLEKSSDIASRLGAFVAERHPFVVADALAAFDVIASGGVPAEEKAIEAIRPAFRRELTRRLRGADAAGAARDHSADDGRGAVRSGVRRSGRRLRRISSPRGDRGVAHAGRAPRDPARHDADARDRQSPEDVLHSAARCATASAAFKARGSARSDRRRSTPRAIRLRRGAGLSRRRRPLGRRRRRAGHSRSRRRRSRCGPIRRRCGWC